MRDEWFIRGEVPMTKAEVRAVSLSKLELDENSVLLDIGAGTGSVCVEALYVHGISRAFAFEKNEEAIGLLVKNREKAGISRERLTVIKGLAPDSFPECFPVLPTHAFIGGSSGRLEVLLKRLLQINSDIRIVVNVIALETLAEVTGLISRQGIEAEIISLQVARARKAGAYHLMQGMNPVYVISLGGKDGE